ncbi:MAG: bifunctional phosphoribosyl-AMP cyclohydrolase/phosphoribosyl-ATP diphosphatase HisIE [Christensenellaceae bacterium]|nr:bifunctional phosphoribosyl-AMP cyclohydrolase/phosphoribosyl-ATP diphosphatase HisIE [Christensenellaceae bacterium]
MRKIVIYARFEGDFGPKNALCAADGDGVLLPSPEGLAALAAAGAPPCFVRGGAQTLDEADPIFAAGASGLLIGPEAMKNPEFPRRVAYKYGTGAVLGLLLAGKGEAGWQALNEDGTPSGRSLAAWAAGLKALGAGALALELRGGGAPEEALSELLPLGLPAAVACGPDEAVSLAEKGAFGLILPQGEIAPARALLAQAGFSALVKGETDLSDVRFDERGLVPAIAQDARSGAVLMLAYMNEESLKKTLETGLATYFSRSRQTLWQKGESSGHVQRVREILYDCDGDTLLLKVEQSGPACHTGSPTCFYRALQTLPGGRSSGEGALILQRVFALILDRKQNPKEGSYTNGLFDKGVDKIGKKLLEEAAETLIAAKNASRDEIAFESADLLYHLMVLLANAGLSLEDVYAELQNRHAGQ